MITVLNERLNNIKIDGMLDADELQTTRRVVLLVSDGCIKPAICIPDRRKKLRALVTLMFLLFSTGLTYCIMKGLLAGYFSARRV